MTRTLFLHESLSLFEIIQIRIYAIWQVTQRKCKCDSYRFNPSSEHTVEVAKLDPRSQQEVIYLFITPWACCIFLCLWFLADKAPWRGSKGEKDRPEFYETDPSFYNTKGEMIEACLLLGSQRSLSDGLSFLAVCLAICLDSCCSMY